MSDNIKLFAGTTFRRLPVDRVCDGAKECREVLILGVDQDGQFYIAGSGADIAQHVFLLAQAQHRILAGEYETHEEEEGGGSDD